MIMVRNIFLTGAALVLAAGGALAQDMPKGDAKAGADHFRSLGCYSCHGIWGQGTYATGRV
jgi:cytochrome c2